MKQGGSRRNGKEGLDGGFEGDWVSEQRQDMKEREELTTTGVRQTERTQHVGVHSGCRR